MEHLLQYVKLQGGLDARVSAPLIEQLQSLCGFRKEAQSAEFQAELQVLDPLKSIENRIAALDNLPDVKVLVQDALIYRQILAQEKHIQQNLERGLVLITRPT